MFSISFCSSQVCLTVFRSSWRNFSIVIFCSCHSASFTHDSCCIEEWFLPFLLPHPLYELVLPSTPPLHLWLKIFLQILKKMKKIVSSNLLSMNNLVISHVDYKKLRLLLHFFIIFSILAHAIKRIIYIIREITSFFPRASPQVMTHWYRGWGPAG